MIPDPLAEALAAASLVALLMLLIFAPWFI